MSFTRFGFDNADVYTFCSRDGFECCGCPTGKDAAGKLILGDSYTTKHAGEFLRHMRGHRDAGFAVPTPAFLGVFLSRDYYRADA